MPELAEAEFYRKRWDLAARGAVVTGVLMHDHAKVFRGTDPAVVRRHLTQARFLDSQAAAKQILFRFSGDSWLGVHLGMSGELRVEAPGYIPQKHDHLALVMAGHTLVFTDPRMFGRVQFHHDPTAPTWWTDIAPALNSPAFSPEALAAFLARRARAPLKAVLLMQERFPGIGNWMADEILWRAALHPKRLAGSLSPAEVRTLRRECRHVARLALATIAGQGDTLPPDLNVHIPQTWLFWHRWENNGRCPKTHTPLAREVVGGRTTCWSPARQKLHPR
jgi:formamidopyrimidine-DNA glycosylase